MCGLCCRNHFSKRWLEPYVVPVTGPIVEDHCSFFDAPANRCSVHPTRPIVCRDHPFILTKRNDVHRLQVHARCPGVGHGPEVDVRMVVGSLLDHVRDLYDMDFMVDWASMGTGDLRIHRIR